MAPSWDDLAAELATEYPGRDWLVDFYREGARTAPDGRVVALAPAEVRGAAPHVLGDHVGTWAQRRGIA